MYTMTKEMNCTMKKCWRWKRKEERREQEANDERSSFQHLYRAWCQLLCAEWWWATMMQIRYGYVQCYITPHYIAWRHTIPYHTIHNMTFHRPTTSLYFTSFQYTPIHNMMLCDAHLSCFDAASNSSISPMCLSSWPSSRCRSCIVSDSRSSLRTSTRRTHTCKMRRQHIVR